MCTACFQVKINLISVTKIYTGNSFQNMQKSKVNYIQMLTKHISEICRQMRTLLQHGIGNRQISA